MQSPCNTFLSERNRPAHPFHRWLRIGISLLATTTLMAYSQSGQQGPSETAGQVDQAVLTADANHTLKPNNQPTPAEPQPKPQISDNPSEVLRRQLADESAELVELAVKLKLAVDRSTHGTLSLQVIHTADSVAKLAHGVKEQMKRAPAQR